MRKKTRKFNAKNNLPNDPSVEVRARGSRAGQQAGRGKRTTRRERVVAPIADLAEVAADETEEGDDAAAGA